MDISAALLIRLEIEAMLADYWHDVDRDWGRNAHTFYTEQGVFESSAGRARIGREQIKDFYSQRQGRGERIARHLVGNLRVLASDHAHASATWVLSLHAADGVAVLPAEPPILIADVTDRCERAADGRWLIAHRRIEALFVGDKPTTA